MIINNCKLHERCRLATAGTLLRTAVAILIIAGSWDSAYASRENRCDRGDRTVNKDIGGGFTLTFSRYPDPTVPEVPECRARVLDPHRRTVFSVHEPSMLLVLAGADVNGDGVPDIVLEGYSGGAHCCWTYYIVSLGTKPGLIREFTNERGAGFHPNQKTGRMEIYAMDGAFDYFDGLSHAEVPFPKVYLQLRGNRFIDISSEHTAEYDRQIEGTRHKIKKEALAQLRDCATLHDFADNDVRYTLANVLAIVFAYLYSGRQSQAHQTLKELWPDFDQRRIWKLILDTRRKGILSYASRAR